MQLDKRIVLAVAGSGKTSLIKDELHRSGRSLVLTYTENCKQNLRRRISNEFGHIPPRICVETYFSFLFRFCLRPLLGDEFKIRGISWAPPPELTRNFTRNNSHRYLTRGNRLYSNRMAGMILAFDRMNELNRRIARYFDTVLIDEIQDFAGHDFNLLSEMSVGNVNLLGVGDFFQHTYDTSRDGSVNRNLHKDIDSFRGKLKDANFDIDETSLAKSHRCSPSVCAFVEQNVGISISSHRNDATTVEYVEKDSHAEQLYRQSDIVKLFYDQHYAYTCNSDNWGASKGNDSYKSVCVVLNDKTERLYKSGDLKSLNERTRNKLYVACTRARQNIYLVSESAFKKFRR